MPPVNEIEARIRRMCPEFKDQIKTILRLHGWDDLEQFVHNASGADCDRMSARLDMMEADALHQEPERDHFKSESPIRAFTTWIVQGDYALGKGFRPSLQHTVTYLDAMERKEGWRLVQILEAGTQTPSFLFRCVREISDEELRQRHPLFNPVMPELKGGAIDPDKEKAAALANEFRENYPLRDDPINPKHYNGTGCAKIIENLPGNLAHAITYVWRAGDKPNQPECQDIDKALWFLNREQHLAQDRGQGEEEYDFLLDGQRSALHWTFKAKGKATDHWFFQFAIEHLHEGMPLWRRSVVAQLVIYALSHKPSDLRIAIQQLNARKTELECGRGLAI